MFDILGCSIIGPQPDIRHIITAVSHFTVVRQFPLDETSELLLLNCVI